MSGHRRHFQMSLTFLLFLLIVGGPLLGVIVPYVIETRFGPLPGTFGSSEFAPSSFGSYGFVPSRCPKCGGPMTLDGFCPACCPCPFTQDEDEDAVQSPAASSMDESGAIRDDGEIGQIHAEPSSPTVP